jgi:aminoglycoside/choline kinase family phosphotransferase
MITNKQTLSVIDYQDAMSGALCYDLVSLLKDCYIEFDPQEIEQLALYFKEKKGLKVSDTEFLRWFDFMGMQRHIKVLGIFSRLSLRDNKDGYLKDIPLTLHYLITSAKKYPQTQEFARFLQKVTQ